MAQRKVPEGLDNQVSIDSTDGLPDSGGAASRPHLAGGRMQRTLEKYRAGQLISLDELIARVRGE